MRLDNLNGGRVEQIEESDKVLDVYHQYKDKVDSGKGMSSDRDVVNGIARGFMETTEDVMSNHRDTMGNTLKVKVTDRNLTRFTVTATVTDPDRKETTYTRELSSVDDLRQFNLEGGKRFIDDLQAKEPIPEILSGIGFTKKR